LIIEPTPARKKDAITHRAWFFGITTAGGYVGVSVAGEGGGRSGPDAPSTRGRVYGVHC
jgi:hypothetical protein